jgi:hypothetical protein
MHIRQMALGRLKFAAESLVPDTSYFEFEMAVEKLEGIDY